MSKININHKIFLASILSFVFFFSFFQSGQAGFFDWFRKNNSQGAQNVAEVISSVKQYTFSVSKNGSGVVTSDDGKINCGKQCLVSYPANSKIILKAEAGNNYKFEKWNGCDKVSDGKCQITINKSKMIVAKFASKRTSSSSSQKNLISSKSSNVSSKASSSKAFSSSKSRSVSNSSKNDNLETGGTVLILVDETILFDLKKELENYTGDIKNELGLNTYIKSVSSSEDIHSLKYYVLDFFKKGNLNGVLLIGNIPTGYFYHPDTPTGVFTSEGLILGDYIYQDFLNACEFSSERNAFSYKNEECQIGVTIQPYWVARLTPNSSNHSDTELLKDYFKRNHEFRNGSYAFEQKALLYQPSILDYEGTEQETTINKIKKDLNSYGGVYSPDNYKFVDIFSLSSDSDYLSELSKGYEVLIFNGHGAPLFHQKNITPKSQINARFFFGNFLSCSVGRFTTKDYLAGEYLFVGGLVSLAASTPVFASPDFDNEFHNMLVNNVSFYKAIEFSGIGSNILGDPTLRMRYNQPIPSQSKIKVSANQLILNVTQHLQLFPLEF